MRRFERSRRARRAGRNREPLQVKSDNQRLALDAIKIDVRSVWHARRAFAIYSRGFGFKQFPLQLITRGRHLLVVTTLKARLRQLSGLAQAHDPGNVLRSRPARAFVTSAVEHGLQLSSLAD